MRTNKMTRMAAMVIPLVFIGTSCTVTNETASPISAQSNVPTETPDDGTPTATPSATPTGLPEDLPPPNPNNPELPPETTTPTDRTGPRPNIVFITTDDMTYSDLKHMPKTRRLLGGKGVTFPNSVSPHPLCCPARAEFVSGQYGQNNGVHHNTGYYGGYKALIDPSNTFARWLNDSGYQTAFVGKYLNGYKPDKAGAVGWTRWNPTYKGVYKYNDTTYYNDGKPKRHRQQADDVTAKYGKLYLEEFSAKKRPFFVWMSALAPHTAVTPGAKVFIPPIPSKRHLGTFFGKNPAAKKSTYERNAKKESGRFYQKRIESLQTVDDTVEMTVQVLKENNKLRNTYIFFTSDNGYLLGEHGIYGKNKLYDEALNVPTLVRVPKVKRGQVNTAPVSTVDFAATFADMARTKPAREQDGESFFGYLSNETNPTWRNTQLVQTGRKTNLASKPGWKRRGVVVGEWSYNMNQKTGQKRLFNRANDPLETTNLARRARYRTLIRELERRTRTLKDCAGANCNQNFGPLPRVPRR